MSREQKAERTIMFDRLVARGKNRGDDPAHTRKSKCLKYLKLFAAALPLLGAVNLMSGGCSRNSSGYTIGVHTEFYPVGQSMECARSGEIDRITEPMEIGGTRQIELNGTCPSSVCRVGDEEISVSMLMYNDHNDAIRVHFYSNGEVFEPQEDERTRNSMYGLLDAASRDRQSGDETSMIIDQIGRSIIIGDSQFRVAFVSQDGGRGERGLLSVTRIERNREESR